MLRGLRSFSFKNILRFHDVGDHSWLIYVYYILCGMSAGYTAWKWNVSNFVIVEEWIPANEKRLENPFSILEIILSAHRLPSEIGCTTIRANYQTEPLTLSPLKLWFAYYCTQNSFKERISTEARIQTTMVRREKSIFFFFKILHSKFVFFFTLLTLKPIGPDSRP